MNRVKLYVSNTKKKKNYRMLKLLSNDHVVLPTSNLIKYKIELYKIILI